MGRLGGRAIGTNTCENVTSGFSASVLTRGVGGDEEMPVHRRVAELNVLASETELQPKLDIARLAGARDLRHCLGVFDIGARGQEMGVIPHVVHLEAEFKVEALRQSE